MKRNICILLFVALLPVLGASGQNYDDVYFVPGKDNDKPSRHEERVEQTHEVVPYTVTEENDYVYDDDDRDGLDMDVDAYNRRYAGETDTTLARKIAPKKQSRVYYEDDDDEGWVNGFNGSQSDYEYSRRLIRYNSPSLAIHVTSPYYWDVVYAADPYDWNVYIDGTYAYAFPTFANPLWWDWRFTRPYYYGWGGYYAGWYGWRNPYYYGWHSPYYGHWYGYHNHWHNWAYGSNRPVYHDNYRTGNRYGGRTDSYRRSSWNSSSRSNSGASWRRGSVSGTRSSATRSSRSSFDRGSSSVRGGDFNSTTRRSSYDRSSSSRSSSRNSSSSYTPSRSSSSRSSMGSGASFRSSSSRSGSAGGSMRSSGSRR